MITPCLGTQFDEIVNTPSPFSIEKVNLKQCAVTVLIVNLTAIRTPGVMGLCSCLWRLSWLSDEGRLVLVMSRTVPWAEDPGLHAMEEGGTLSTRSHSSTVCPLTVDAAEDPLLQALWSWLPLLLWTGPWAVAQNKPFFRELPLSECFNSYLSTSLIISI